jgi:hypothetical protein
VGVKRDLVLDQKRPITEVKETYYSSNTITASTREREVTYVRACVRDK